MKVPASKGGVETGGGSISEKSVIRSFAQYLSSLGAADNTALEARRRFAHVAWSATLKEYPGLSDSGVLGCTRARCELGVGLAGHSDEQSENLLDLLKIAIDLPPFQFLWLFSARWYSCALPRVVWHSPQFVASLMATGGVSRDPELLALVQPPWPAFFVDIPEGLVYAKHVEDGEPDPITTLMVQVIRFEDEDGSEKTSWQFLAEGERGTEVWRHGLSAEQLLEVDEETLDPTFSADLTSMDERTMKLLGRLIVGLCLTFSDPSKVRESKGTSRKHSQSWQKRLKAEPGVTNFVVGVPVQIDCREHIREWVLGKKKGGSPTVRTLVRGHFKGQHYGTKNSLMKVIWRQPFWRGLDDAPTVSRDHVVAGEKD